MSHYHMQLALCAISFGSLEAMDRIIQLAVPAEPTSATPSTPLSSAPTTAPSSARGLAEAHPLLLSDTLNKAIEQSDIKQFKDGFDKVRAAYKREVKRNINRILNSTDGGTKHNVEEDQREEQSETKQTLKETEEQRRLLPDHTVLRTWEMLINYLSVAFGPHSGESQLELMTSENPEKVNQLFTVLQGKLETKKLIAGAILETNKRYNDIITRYKNIALKKSVAWDIFHIIHKWVILSLCTPAAAWPITLTILAIIHHNLETLPQIYMIQAVPLYSLLFLYVAWGLINVATHRTWHCSWNREAMMINDRLASVLESLENLSTILKKVEVEERNLATAIYITPNGKTNSGKKKAKDFEGSP